MEEENTFRLIADETRSERNKKLDAFVSDWLPQLEPFGMKKVGESKFLIEELEIAYFPKADSIQICGVWHKKGLKLLKEKFKLKKRASNR